MTQLVKTRCNKGFLVAYDNQVAIEFGMLGTKNSNAVPYSQVTGVDVKTTMAKIPVICKGYGTVTIYTKGNQTLEAKTVLLDEAYKIRDIIFGKI